MIPLISSPHFPRAYCSPLFLTCPPPLLSSPSSSPLLATTRLRVSAMPIDDSSAPLRQPAANSLHLELKDESDFDQILSPEGLVSICGFGSLLSERSARSTFPDLINFRIAKLNGFRRVFAHAAPIFFERGIARPETKEISSLSVEPYEGETLIVTTFEIQKSEIPAFIGREHEFRFLAVTPETLNGLFYTTPSEPVYANERMLVIIKILYCPISEIETLYELKIKDRTSSFLIFANPAQKPYALQVSPTFDSGSDDIFFQRYGRYGITKIWMDDILPCRAYLRHCVLAAKNLSDMAYDNFLDHTFLGDRKTSIREYLATSGSGIMEEEPPEDLKDRYGG